MSRLSKRFYVPRCKAGTGPFGPEILTGQFLIARYPPKWLDLYVLIHRDGTIWGEDIERKDVARLLSGPEYSNITPDISSEHDQEESSL